MVSKEKIFKAGIQQLYIGHRRLGHERQITIFAGLNDSRRDSGCCHIQINLSCRLQAALPVDGAGT